MSVTTFGYSERIKVVEEIQGLVGWWTFSDLHSQIVRSRGGLGMPLRPAARPLAVAPGGVFGETSAALGPDHWLMAPASTCGPLAGAIANSAVSVLAWVRRRRQSEAERLSEVPGEVPTEDRELFLCEAIAGLWNETDCARQFALFVGLRLWGGRDQVCGHVSDTGTSTPGSRYCTTASVGQTQISDQEWHCVAFTFDGEVIISWLDGELDAGERNPMPFGSKVFGPGPRSDFTVGAVSRKGVIGNNFYGDISGLAVYDRALTSAEMYTVSKGTLAR